MPTSIGLSWLVVGVCSLVCVYKFLLLPLLISPLSRIPSAHPLAKVTPLWILWIRYRNCENSTIHAAHQKHGPVIQLGPNELSVNCVKGGILTVYSGGFEKSDWYDLFANYDGVRNMFSMPVLKQHSARKRMLSNVYSKSYLQSSPVMSSITKSLINERFLPKLQSYADSYATFNIYAIFSGIAMDFVTAYLFGLDSGSDMTRDDEFRTHFLGLYDSRRSFNFWSQEMPAMTSFLGHLGINLVPSWVSDANTEIENWTLSMCNNAISFLQRTQAVNSDSVPSEEVHNFPTVYSQLQSAMAKTSSKEQVDDPERNRLAIASEVLDHLAAGFDTSGITLTYIIHELSQRPGLQASLRTELLALDSPVLLSQLQEPKSASFITAKVLDNLPLLNAIIDETLRLRSAIPGPEPRITPPGGCTLGPEGEYPNIPGGMRISAQAHSLHRNPDVFDEPDLWVPERYLNSSEEKLKEMRRWFWAFGSGGRMCVGSNLALQEIRYVLAAIYTNFTTHIVDDNGIEQLDIYTAPPKGGKLLIRLEHATN